MRPAEDPSQEGRVGGTLWIFVTLAGVAGAVTLMFLAMRAVMDVGGYCAEGGPYEIRQHCPKGVTAILLGSIWGGLALTGLYAWQVIKRGVPSFLGFVWPALFLSLGWNFFEFGFDPPGGAGLEWGWLVCGILFALMGGLPLLAVVPAFLRNVRGTQGPRSVVAGNIRSGFATMRALRKQFRGTDWKRMADEAARASAAAQASGAWGTGAPSGSAPWGTGAPPGSAPWGGSAPSGSAPGAASGSSPWVAGSPTAGTSGAAPSGLVAVLERLDALHRSGALNDEQYEAAKRQVLEGR